MINIGIVGLGYWGPNFARIVFEHPDANLLWCCDISRKKLDEIKSRYKNIELTTNVEDVLQNPSVDGVIIAVPASLHYKITKKALLSNKHVLVEKPLASSRIEAKELVDLAKEKKKVLFVDHIFLFNPAIQKIKQIVKAGELGEIFYGHSTYTALGPIRVDVSAMWDLSIHFIYTIIYLLGEYPTSISAFGRGFLVPKNADVAFLNLEFGKKIFNLKVSWLDPVKTRQLVLVGDKKMVIFEDTQINKVTILDKGVEHKFKNGILPEGYRFIMRDGDIILPHIPNAEPLKEVLENFIMAVDQKTTSLVDPLDSINTITLLEAAEYSLRKRGLKIKLGLDKKKGLLEFKK